MLKLHGELLFCVNIGGKINDILLFFSRCSLSHSSDLRHTHLTTHTLDLVLHDTLAGLTEGEVVSEKYYRGRLTRLYTVKLS